MFQLFNKSKTLPMHLKSILFLSIIMLFFYYAFISILLDLLVNAHNIPLKTLPQIHINEFIHVYVYVHMGMLIVFTSTKITYTHIQIYMYKQEHRRH